MRRCVRLQAAGATSSSPSALSPGSSTAVRGPVRSAVGATASFLTTRWGAATTSAAGAARATGFYTYIYYGFALISKYLQCSYPEALAAVEKFCGIVVHSPSSVQESAEQIEPQADLNPDPISKARAAMLALWSEAHPVEQGDPVWNYLLSRGLILEAPIRRSAPTRGLSMSSKLRTTRPENMETMARKVRSKARACGCARCR